jgi:putative ABC transport system ATP-binding protein
LVDVKNLSKEYKRGGETLVVLDNLNLEIPKQDYLALMGPSGSGKSTLLNLIGGLDTPSNGSVSINGERIDKMNSRQLSNWRASNVGFIFQFYNLLPVLSAQKNIELPLLLTKLSSSQRKKHVETALSIVGLSDRASHKPNELSGGQQQRVAIARALVSDPDILVCDEPTGDLDRDTATEILNLLKSLNEDHGKTILMVTHDPAAAESAKRSLHLDKGKLIA